MTLNYEILVQELLARERGTINTYTMIMSLLDHRRLLGNNKINKNKDDIIYDKIITGKH